MTQPQPSPSTHSPATSWNSPGPFDPAAGHEQIAYCHDNATGLKAIIGIHSSALGPALGGTRFFPYASEDDALRDVLRLSHGMTYKNALAGLDLGGGKAVIIGDPKADKSEALLRAYGRFVESLGGRYITACDVGTVVADMDVVGRETRHAAGRSESNGGCGDSSILTAFGVFQSMRATAEHVWGTPTLAGRTVGVAGVGKVGRVLVGHLLEDGAHVVVTDVDATAVDRLRRQHPQVEVADDATSLAASDLDVFAPCAMGGAIDEGTVATLRAKIVCGAANNQLVDESEGGTAQQLLDRGIVYAPDYLVNAGGVIQVYDELGGFNFQRCKERAAGLFDTTAAVLRLADERGISPATAAGHLAEERIASVGNTRRIWLP